MSDVKTLSLAQVDAVLENFVVRQGAGLILRFPQSEKAVRALVVVLNSRNSGLLNFGKSEADVITKFNKMFDTGQIITNLDIPIFLGRSVTQHHLDFWRGVVFCHATKLDIARV